jgi:hypothetical protein
MKTNQLTSVKRLSIGIGLVSSLANIITANPSFAQSIVVKQPISQICRQGAPITQNCVPKDGNFRLMPPGYSVDPRTGIITTPPKELPKPKPEPRPGNESIPSINIR